MTRIVTISTRMADVARRWCWPCAAAAWGLFLVCSVALAANGPTNGPTWQSVAIAAIGCISILVGVYARGIERRIETAQQASDSNTQHLAGIKLKLAEEHMTKDEIKAEFESLHRRFDSFIQAQTRGREL